MCRLHWGDLNRALEFIVVGTGEEVEQADEAELTFQKKKTFNQYFFFKQYKQIVIIFIHILY